jgi:hypothetical protein
MSISGVVITLSENADARANALAVLATDARLQIGEPVGTRLPVVIETGDATEAEDLVRDLFDLAGVSFVDVVSVDISLDR